MKRAFGRFGFTLVEVNLAIFVMAVGVLSMCALYAFGYRENRQSEEDVFATAYADSYLAPLVAGLSSPQLDWDAWKQIGDDVSAAAIESGIGSLRKQAFFIPSAIKARPYVRNERWQYHRKKGC